MGRVAAICAQCVIILATFGSFLATGITRSSSSPEAMAGVLSLCAYLSVWNVFFIVAIWRQWGWFPAFGLITGGLSLLAGLPPLFSHIDPYKAITELSWLVTCSALAVQLRGKKARNAWIGAGLALALVVAPAGFIVYSFVHATGLQGGTAPEKSFKERRQWAQSLDGYRVYFNFIDSWVRKSEMITADIGQVRDIAPSGKPNYYQGCFTDGCYAAMNLEVVGEKGTGMLLLPGVDADDSQPPVLHPLGKNATWTYNGETDIIDKSGKSALEAAGLKEMYDALMGLDPEKDSAELCGRFDAFKERFERKDAASLAMYKMRLQARFAQAFAHEGDRARAAGLYADAADYLLDKVRDTWFEDKLRQKADPLQNKFAFAQAAVYLRKAHELAPQDLRVLFGLGNRVEMWYVAATGGEKYAPYNSSARAREAWAKRTLGIFYQEASDWIRRSPETRKKVGMVLSITPDDTAQNDVYVSGGRYGSFMNLNVRGLTGKMTVAINVEEKAGAVPCIDLFSDSPRMPVRPVEVKSVTWPESKGQR